MLQALLLKALSLKKIKQRKSLFSNKDLKKATEKNKGTDKASQEL